MAIDYPSKIQYIFCSPVTNVSNTGYNITIEFTLAHFADTASILNSILLFQICIPVDISNKIIQNDHHEMGYDSYMHVLHCV